MIMEERKEILLRGRLDGKQRLRLEKLLDMLYKPSELAEQVGFNRRQVYRVYIHVGCPHVRDDRKHLWINGEDFRKWYEATYPRLTLAGDEGFCLSCKKPVKLEKARKKKSGDLIYWIGFCQICGRKISRIINNIRSE
jgi:hypothetical protein